MAASLAASVAALVAVYGYLLTQAESRRERPERTFAEALNATSTYADMAYRVRRHPREYPDN